jgi:FkbM family methyltransferase
MKLKDVLRLLTNPVALRAHRELRRIERLPRYQTGVTDLFGPQIEFVDNASFGFIYEELFIRRSYEFVSDTPTPRIIDGGANIGLSVLFFKGLYPRSTIVAFEADRLIFDVLQRNVTALNLKGVELHREALWRERGEVAFTPEGADSGRVIAGVESACRVPSVPLSDLLAQPADLVKLDIEGAEFEVLQAAKPQLHQVKQLFVEYHSVAGQPQHLPELLSLLKAAGFRLYVTAPCVLSPRPLVRIEAYSGFDMVLNIFGTRVKN